MKPGLFAGVHAPRPLASTQGAYPPFHPFWFAPAAWTDSFKDTGIHVTPELALSVSAIWAAVTFMGRNLGASPCQLHRRFVPREGAAEGKELAKTHPLFRTLRWRPNTIQTAQEYFEQGVGHVLLRGNFYARIQEGSRSFAEQLIPMHPDRVRPERLPNGRVRYQLTPGWRGGFNHALSVSQDEPQRLAQEEVHHVRGFTSGDPVMGLSLPAVAGRSIGAAIATDTYAARFFKQGATASLSVTVPDELDDESEKELHESITRYLGGLDNVGGVLIVDNGASIDKLGINPQDAQLLPTREHVVREVARWIGVPTQVLADAGKEPTHASAEVFNRTLVTQSFRPMGARFTHAIARDLFLPDEVDELIAIFNFDDLLQGDLKARAQYLQILVLAGIMTRNEARDREDLNPGPPELDEYLQPKNIGIAGEDEEEDAGTLDTVPRRNRAQIAARFSARATALALEAAEGLVKRELTAVRKLATKHAADGEAWAAGIRTFYHEHAVVVSKRLKVSLSAAREYCARQGLALERSPNGVGVTEDWLWTVPPDLAALALGDDGVVALKE